MFRLPSVKLGEGKYVHDSRTIGRHLIQRRAKIEALRDEPLLAGLGILGEEYIIYKGFALGPVAAGRRTLGRAFGRG